MKFEGNAVLVGKNDVLVEKNDLLIGVNNTSRQLTK